VIEVPLSEEAIAAINLASGGRFAVGVGVETLRLASGSEGIRFSLADETRTHQLVLTEAPMAPPTLELDPAVAAAVPPAEHVLVALAADGTGAALAGATVAFSIVAGPHTGAAASAVTDAGGVAEFAYTGGAAGVDHIVASLAAAGGSAPEAHAMAVWDADCNGNGVPDTCDLACAGFEGACAEFAGCGASLDADADALPDECSANAPPDCSQVSAQPVQLRRPDRHFREVRLGGASDPDGDPVQLHVDAVHQDEPSEIYGFASTCPDARGLGGDRVWLRAERRVRSDGRVYHVDFSADDGRGGSCTGSVTVCVPREGWRHQASCVDQGPRFDSLSCRPRRHPHRGWRPHRDD
jgi:hypothetical protein